MLLNPANKTQAVQALFLIQDNQLSFNQLFTGVSQTSLPSLASLLIPRITATVFALLRRALILIPGVVTGLVRRFVVTGRLMSGRLVRALVSGRLMSGRLMSRRLVSGGFMLAGLAWPGCFLLTAVHVPL